MDNVNSSESKAGRGLPIREIDNGLEAEGRMESLRKCQPGGSQGGESSTELKPRGCYIWVQSRL